MQFIERNMFAVRSAVFHLRRREGGLEFVLFPMIHVGEQSFYDGVAERLVTCDFILFEGVPSRKVAALTRAYRHLDKMKRLGLVSQHSLNLRQFRDRLVHADMNAEEFGSGWSKLPPSEKFLVAVLVPVFVVIMFVCGTKELLGDYLEVEDLPSRRDIFLKGDALEDLIVDQRDAVLIRRIEAFHAEHGASDKKAAILYGAAHMPAVVRFLKGRLKYHVTKSEWLTVFEFDAKWDVRERRKKRAFPARGEDSPPLRPELGAGTDNFGD
ncbi:MAG: hypothetical protein HY329_06090 [Chloroflexi bacterium]|nr:hypothetical protein [Chloroflexota bacterium]